MLSTFPFWHFRRPFPQPHAALHFRLAFLHGHPAVRLFFFWLHFDLQLHVCLKRSKKQGEIVKPKRVPSNSFVTNKKLLNSPPFAESCRFSSFYIVHAFSLTFGHKRPILVHSKISFWYKTVFYIC